MFQNLKWGEHLRRRMLKMMLSDVSCGFCFVTLLRVLSRAAPRHGARPALLFLGSKYGCYVIFSFCGTSCTGCARALHLATMQKLNWKGPGQSTECTHFVRHANLLGLSQNGHPRTTSCVSTQAGRSL